MTTYQQYHGKFTIDAECSEFTVGGNAVSLTTGDYYIVSYDGEGSNQLIEHLRDQIRAAHADLAWSTVEYDWDGTGLITITLFGPSGEQSMDIVWTHPRLKELLGFDGDQTGLHVYTSTYPPRYVWRPSRPVKTEASLYSWWVERTNSRVARGPQGHIGGNRGDVLYDGIFEYLMLPETEVRITSSSTGMNQLQRFFGDVAHATQPIRCYPNRANYTTADMKEGIWAPIGEEGIGSWEEYRARHTDGWDGRWNARFRLWKYVTS